MAKIQKEIEESMTKVDWDKMKTELEKVKEVDMKKMQEEMEKVKVEMKDLGPKMEKELSKARVRDRESKSGNKRT
jgi:hypothetical protein